MRTFTFFKMREPSVVPYFEILPFENMEMAKTYARSLLVENGFAAVEVTDGECSELVTTDRYSVLDILAATPL